VEANQAVVPGEECVDEGVLPQKLGAGHLHAQERVPDLVPGFDHVDAHLEPPTPAGHAHVVPDPQAALLVGKIRPLPAGAAHRPLGRFPANVDAAAGRLLQSLKLLPTARRAGLASAEHQLYWLVGPVDAGGSPDGNWTRTRVARPCRVGVAGGSTDFGGLVSLE